MSSDDQQVPRSTVNGSGDEVDGNEPERRPEGQGDQPAGRPRQQQRFQEQQEEAEPWDPDPNHPANLHIAGIAAEAGRIVFVQTHKKTPKDKQKNDKSDKH